MIFWSKINVIGRENRKRFFHMFVFHYSTVSTISNAESECDRGGSGSKKERRATAAARFTIYRINKASRKKREKSSAKKERKATKTLAIVLGKITRIFHNFFLCIARHDTVWTFLYLLTTNSNAVERRCFHDIIDCPKKIWIILKILRDDTVGLFRFRYKLGISIFSWRWKHCGGCQIFDEWFVEILKKRYIRILIDHASKTFQYIYLTSVKTTFKQTNTSRFQISFFSQRSLIDHGN